MWLAIQEEQEARWARLINDILGAGIKRSELCAADVDLLEELTLHQVTDVAACGRIVSALAGIRQWIEFAESGKAEAP